MKYRKRPIEVEAYRCTEACEIHTLEGIMVAEPGDWIVTGPHGDTYPVKDHIFLATYEPVPDIQSDPIAGRLSRFDDRHLVFEATRLARDPRCTWGQWDAMEKELLRRLSAKKE